MTSRMEAEADAHRELLQSIQAVDYAPPTLKQVSRQLATTKKELESEQARLGDLVWRTYVSAFATLTISKKEFKEWRDIEERAHKRLWVKIKHPNTHKEKLAGMEDKEEREYIEALGKEQACKSRIETLTSQLNELEIQVKDLEPYAAEHAHLRKQLEDLYARVFDGPTPAFPEEDDAEDAYKAALTDYNELQGAIANEGRALQLLLAAQKAMNTAIAHANTAENYSTYDMMGGGTWTDMMERSELANAQRAVDQAKLLVAQARTLQPSLQNLPQLNMPQGSIWSDVVFDNFFSDYAFHQKIQAAGRQLRMVLQGLQGMVEQSKRHLGGLQSLVPTSAGRLEGARERLEGVRRSIMERAARGELGSYTRPPGPPPGGAPPPAGEEQLPAYTR
ncbi:uncharacterized protein LOC62_01G001696 [Vanrija pseudolonga]|uniref:Uncharacterized protein n=1 Tax=Vanrija pseudolonga TaxID=143232 RepID=A0AAF0Y1B6_9TREE|nr:hypothetical protein LOC62_01G001696 [Vanrija pseudolonga]